MLSSVVNLLPVPLLIFRLESDDRIVFIDSNLSADRLFGIGEIFSFKSLMDCVEPDLEDLDIKLREVVHWGVPWSSELISLGSGEKKGCYECQIYTPLANTVAILFYPLPKEITKEFRSQTVSQAQVTAEILHNVGNVLNSVNILSELLKQRIEQLKLDSVLKVSGLIQQNMGNLGDYLTTDVAGKKIPNFLEQFGQKLILDQKELMEHFSELSEYVSHVTNIVRIQKFAGKSVSSTVIASYSEIMDDALRIFELSLKKYGILIERNYEELPPVSIDRNQVMQILVNLLGNAKHAMIDDKKPDKKLVLEVRQVSDDTIEMSVCDNGIGIAEEHLSKIFEYGFTTKKSGHGFGLHSSSCKASELGGSLTMTSAGLGKGATFVLRLPFMLQLRSQE